jgi:hypothetical protein
MDRHAATLRQRHLAETAGIKVARAHPHMLRALVTAMLDAGVDLRDVQIAAVASTGANLSMYWNTHSRSPRLRSRPSSISIVLIGNQIAESALEVWRVQQ